MKQMIVTHARITINIDLEKFRLNIAAELFKLLSSLCGVRSLGIFINLQD